MKWALTFATGLMVLALPAQGAPQVSTRTIATIRLVSTTTSSQVLTDRPPAKQVSKGDVLVVWSTLRNAVAQFGRPKGVVVGDNAVFFTVRSSTATDVLVVSHLPGGTLRAAGHTRLGAKQSFTVTGGTGRFAGAHGTGESLALTGRWGSGNRRLLHYQLTG